jgi:hypothetical protein
LKVYRCIPFLVSQSFPKSFLHIFEYVHHQFTAKTYHVDFDQEFSDLLNLLFSSVAHSKTRLLNPSFIDHAQYSEVISILRFIGHICLPSFPTLPQRNPYDTCSTLLTSFSNHQILFLYATESLTLQ